MPFLPSFFSFSGSVYAQVRIAEEIRNASLIEGRRKRHPCKRSSEHGHCVSLVLLTIRHFLNLLNAKKMFHITWFRAYCTMYSLLRSQLGIKFISIKQPLSPLLIVPQLYPRYSFPIFCFMVCSLASFIL